MSDTRDSSPDRLEGLLRRWGVEEAARTTATPPAPAPPERRKRPRRVRLRWLPAAAAAGLMIAGAAMFVASLGERSAARRQADDDRREIQALRKDLGALREALSAAQSALGDAGRRITAIADSAGQFRARAERLQKTADARAAELATAGGKLALLAGDLQTKTGELAALSDKLDAQQGKVRAAEKKMAEAEKLANANSRLQQAAQEELRRMRDMHARALAAERLVRGKLAAESGRLAAMWVDLQNAYLSAAAPHDVALPARQAAARSQHMLARCAALRGAVRDQHTLRLMDRLEVVLTRLDLIDPYPPGQVKAFAELVRKNKLISQIDDALAGGGMNPDVRSWLFEARVILMGADRVG